MEQHVSEQYDPAQADEALAEAAHDVADVEEAEDTALEDAFEADLDNELDEDVEIDDTVDVEGADEIAAVEDDADDDSDDDSDDEGEPAEAADEDPLEAFRRELWAKPGDWFVVHTYSGMENRVKQNLENRIHSLNMEDYIHEIVEIGRAHV